MKRTFKSTYFWYSVMFLIVTLVTMGFLFVGGVSLVENNDGIGQHFPALIYWHNEVINLLLHHSYIPKFDWHFGLGQDTIGVLSYYVIGDIFFYPSLIFPASLLGYYYTVAAIFRVYLIGISFIFAAKRISKLSQIGLLIGALVYTFSGYTSRVLYTHPFFSTALIILPLLVLNVYKVSTSANKRNRIGLTLVVAWALVNNFYFGELLGIGTFVFWISLLATHRELVRVKSILSVILSVITGAMISAVILLPSLIQVMGSARTGHQLANGLSVYPLSYYVSLPGTLISNFNMEFWVVGGVIGFGVMGCVWSLRRWKQFKTTNVIFLLAVLAVMFPVVAAFINGGSSPSNRWVFMLLFPIALSAARMVTNCVSLSNKDILIMFVVGILSAFSLFAISGFNVGFSAAFVVFTFFAELVFLSVPLKKMGSYGNTLIVPLFMIFMTLINAAVIMRGTHTNQWDSEKSELISYSALRKIVSEQNNYYTHGRILVGNDELGAFKGVARYGNLPSIGGKHNIESYWSLQNNDLFKFSKALQNKAANPNIAISNLDNRSILLKYLGVKHVYVRPGSGAPLGYKATGRLVNGQIDYSTSNVLPLVFAQKERCSARKFSRLSPSSKEGAIIGTQVVNGAIKVRQEASADFASQIVPIKRGSVVHQSITVHRAQNLNNGAKSINLCLEKSMQGRELHVSLQNIVYVPYSFRQRYSNAVNQYNANGAMGNRRNTRLFKMNWLKNNLLSNSNGGLYSINFNYGGYKNYFNQSGRYDLSFFNPESATTINLGEVQRNNSTLTLTLPPTGYISFKLTVWVTPSIKQTDLAISQDDAAKSMKISPDKISFTSPDSVKKTAVLSSTIPYSTGWHLKGSDKILPRVNYGFIGIPNKEGKIILYYDTPGLRTGMLVTLLGLVAFAIEAFGYKGRQKKK
ncbi:YfhO family protein [Lacticaseibacillus thailandensis]|uniref:YfhO family protein n=1 Tax=Lacticaseibacillus thailandensis TaxID=381741 RepID=UPI0007055270|nr:YfhO family protein [Lacticaseibacillus thailandensis]